jgi:excinuclease UvrABC nuclease subunit
MGTKKVKYNESGILALPNDKPALYRIETEGGKLNYAGTAQRSRVRERIKEHLGEIPGATVRIEQFSSIENAREKESNVIKRNQPKYNEQGK